MARNPHAVWDPLGPQTEPRMTAHDIFCVHTMAGSFSGSDSYFHQNGYGGTESHYGVAGSGFAKQWQDTDFQADANLEGNPRVISVETADMGESFPGWAGSDVPFWTNAQGEKIALIAAHDCMLYAIPPSIIPDSKPGRRGLAVHRQGIDGNFTGDGIYGGRVAGGELWSSASGKACPGDRRITQFVTLVAPRIQQIVYGLGDLVMDAEVRAEFDAIRADIESLPVRCFAVILDQLQEENAFSDAFMSRVASGVNRSAYDVNSRLSRRLNKVVNDTLAGNHIDAPL